MSPVTTPPSPLLLRRFQAVAEETRLAIVHLLGDGERCVCELQDALDAGQSRLSFHLKKLKDAGVVSDRREGRWVYYRLVPEVLEEMRTVLGELKPDGAGAWGAVDADGGEGRVGGCCT
jgi:ArsR family transcriptional regulator